MAVLGASSYTFAEATWTQTLPDWIGSHVRMFRFFGGVPRLNGVRFAQSCILGRLRNQIFFSLAEANAAIGQALDRINDHVMRRLGVSRRQLFETVERPALASLPLEDYEFAEWRLARVSTDYHVEFKTFFYSVPYSLIRQQQPHNRTPFHRTNRHR
ncbi:hypothetical protein [Mesorhizobium sp.]|uniref:Mu transposase domain-containing protein n=1 Tax=Mesorhizobium sp. TaxID=1871066 RepID=UPI00257CF91A|nr:hypothetical protein [Mesorhizobium sp.]